MKSTGFSNSDITKQYVWRAVLVTIAGIFLGTMLAGTVGEQLAGAAMASLGGIGLPISGKSAISLSIVTCDLAFDSSDRSDSQYK